MSGLLRIRVDGVDPQSCRLTLDTSSGTERSGKSLQLQMGQEALLRMPDYLFEGGEAESQVLLLRAERDQLEDRIKQLEEHEASQLVASDETDAHRIRAEREALHNAQEQAKALIKVVGHLDPLLETNLEQLTHKKLDAVAKDYGLKVEGNKDAKVATIKSQYDNADPAEKVEILLGVLSKLDDEAKRLEIKAHRHANAEAYRDDINTGSAVGDVLGVRSHQGAAEAEAAKEEKARMLQEAENEDREEKSREDFLNTLASEAAHAAERPARSDQSDIARKQEDATMSLTAKLAHGAGHADQRLEEIGGHDIERQPGKKEVIEQHGSEDAAALKEARGTNDTRLETRGEEEDEKVSVGDDPKENKEEVKKARSQSKASKKSQAKQPSGERDLPSGEKEEEDK